MKRRADQPFLGLIILRQTFEKGKREEFPGSEQKGNIAKPRHTGEGVPGALPGYNKSVLRGVFTSCAEAVQREFWINLDWYTPQHMPAYSHRLASKSKVMRLWFLGSKLSLLCIRFYNPASMWCKLNLIGAHNPQSHRAKAEGKRGKPRQNRLLARTENNGFRNTFMTLSDKKVICLLKQICKQEGQGEGPGNNHNRLLFSPIVISSQYFDTWMVGKVSWTPLSVT